MGRWLLALVLVMSLAANIYLLATRATTTHGVAIPRSEQDTSPAEPAFAMPKIELPPEPPHLATSYAELSDDELAQRLARTEAQIPKLFPSEEKYRLAPRSRETEAKVKPYLDRVFKQDVYQVECHGLVCKLDTDVDASVWAGPLQTTYPERVMFRSMAFGRTGTFIEFFETAIIGAMFNLGIERAFAMSPEREKCIAANHARGDVTLDVRFDLVSRKFTVTASGSLAGEPVGACLRGVMEAITAQTYVPSDVTSLGTRPIRVQLPPESGSDGT